jgi:sugar phosphate isomerase/epimerase
MRSEKPSDLAAAVRATGMHVSAIHAMMDWALPDDPDPRAQVDRLLEAALAAKASLIICVAPLRLGAFPPELDISALASERLGELASIARPLGIHLALEQVGRSSSRPGAVSGIRSLQAALTIAERAGDDVLLAVDSYNLATAGEPFDRLRSVPPGRIGIAHLADLEPLGGGRALAGQGTLDLAGFARALLAVGYSGPLSLEIFPSAPWPDPLAFAREALAAVRSCIARGSMDSGRLGSFTAG